DTMEAFHYLQHAKQIGKVVVSAAQLFTYKEDATYLITGGTGGLGLELAKHLLERGVKHLVLTSRSKPSEQVMQWMSEQKADIKHHQADVADKKALQKVFGSIAQSEYPLQGIFHTAGLLRDERIVNLTEDDINVVLAPKVQGSMNLHELSQNLPLDCFVLFSSIAAQFGNMGQANYAAANAFMDGLALQRHQQGLPALSINWGPFAKVGMAASLESQHRAQGMIPLEVRQAFATLDSLLDKQYPDIAILQADWAKMATSDNTWFSHLVNLPAAAQGEWHSLLAATPIDKRIQVLSSQLKIVLAEILSLPTPETIDNNQGFFEMGMDSLMAVDLKNRLQVKTGNTTRLHNTLAFDYSNVSRLAAWLFESVFSDLELPVSHKKTDTAEQTLLDDIKDMSLSDLSKLADDFLSDD
ncbi:MAG: beta-ketoacyl reductase, partial [Prosthecobacter sp.]|nr:beta-ketoacyl reductase [Prosthecobacter sp.]